MSEVSCQIQRASGAGYAVIATLGANANSYSDTTATANTSYAYIVTAVARDGRTNNSTVSYVTTPAASSGGGGGSSDWWMLLILTSLTGLMRLRRKTMNG